MSDQDLEKWSGRAKIPGFLFEGPQEVRDTFIRAKGIEWTASYIDPATWIPQSQTLVSYTGYGFDQIMQGASILCGQMGITVREGGERIKIKRAQAEYEARTNPPRRNFAQRDAAE